MMPTADRIQKDPSRGARKSPSYTADLDFRAVGPALHILQLNVEELPAAKRVVIQSLAETHRIHVICLEETHIDSATSNCYTIRGAPIIGR